MQSNRHNSRNILEVDEVQQYRTVDELIESSRPGSIYYTLLILSALIVAAGLLLDNSPIVIGGMLVTPVMTPLLMISLGIATGELKPIRREGALIFKSFVLIVFVSLVLGFILGSPESAYLFENSIRVAVLYFIVALTSGVAATFAWARKEMAVALPGVAIAVSLVPPLALIGIGLSAFSMELVRFYFFILIFNFLGVIIGSLIVFSLLKFYKAEAEVKEKTAEVELQEKAEKEEHARQKQIDGEVSGQG